MKFSGTLFRSNGSHTYAEESAADHAGSNPYTITTTISHEAAPIATATSSATVSDPAVTPTGNFVVTATERSENHTPAVQSHSNPVCRLLLEKYNTSIN